MQPSKLWAVAGVLILLAVVGGVAWYFTPPLKTQETLPGTQEVLVYFTKAAPESSCGYALAPVPRQVPNNRAIRAALDALLAGPTEAEKVAGYSIGINPGTVVRSIVVTSGTIAADFNLVLSQGVTGTCRAASIKAAITQTLLQFPGMNKAVISIEGRAEAALEP